MHNRRRKKLIEPRLQLKFSRAFLATAVMMVLAQALTLSLLLQHVADQLPQDGAVLQAELPRIMLYSFALTFVLMAPLSLVVGVRTTFPVVGPIYRFRVYLSQLIAGERPGPCKIRDGDELQDFCALLNEATAPLRERAQGASGATPAAVEAPHADVAAPLPGDAAPTKAR